MTKNPKPTPDATAADAVAVQAVPEKPEKTPGKADKTGKESKVPKKGTAKAAPEKASVVQTSPEKAPFASCELFAPSEPREGVPVPVLNRELSWLQFDSRVLDEALDPCVPLLERVKFIAIFSNNLDEFFMIRVSALRRQLIGEFEGTSPDGLTVAEQLAAIRKEVVALRDRCRQCWEQDLYPKLVAEGIEILSCTDLVGKQKTYVQRFFNKELFSVLTPLAFDLGHPFPHISNLSINLAVVLEDEDGEELFARLKVPESFPRLLPLPEEEDAGKMRKMGLRRVGQKFVLLEDVIRTNIDALFPGLKVKEAIFFRVTRDADIEIEEDEAQDLLSSIREGIDRRRFGSVVRLQIEKKTPKRIREILMYNLGVELYQYYPVLNPLGLSCLMALTAIDRPDLKYSPMKPYMLPDLTDGANIFDLIRKNDILLYHPYDSFAPVIDFVRTAARDPNVLAIKQTLYRTGKDSPIVQALTEACNLGKQVAVLVELKARFDEEANIGWAKALESAGVHVVYGLMGLKTHAKVCMVVRREKGGIRRYVHLGTGNYNAVTANIYTDFGLLTCDPDIGADVSDLFNYLTGYSRLGEYRKLLVAPASLRRGILSRIEREIACHERSGGGRIVFKVNSLVDMECIEALYRASCKGVRIDLQVRGMCCLKPGVPDLSENIRVTSIVGRFLEHPRIFYFRNGGGDELFLGSADLMPRNLDRRVETVFPVEDPHIKDKILRMILPVHLSDNVDCMCLNEHGRYERVRPNPKDSRGPISSQNWMIEHRGEWHRRDTP